jgi:hypothetical protein
MMKKWQKNGTAQPRGDGVCWESGVGSAKRGKGVMRYALRVTRSISPIMRYPQRWIIDHRSSVIACLTIDDGNNITAVGRKDTVQCQYIVSYWMMLQRVLRP